MPKELTFAEGTIAATHGAVALNLSIDWFSRTEFKVPREIFKLKQTPIILGMAFFTKTMCEIDLEKRIITIDGHKFELALKTPKNQLDKMLIERTEINFLTETHDIQPR